MTADTLICWRLYVVWSRQWWVLVVPGILLIVEAGEYDSRQRYGLPDTLSLSVVLSFAECILVSNLDLALHHSHAIRVLEIISGVGGILVNVIATPMTVGRLWSVP